MTITSRISQCQECDWNDDDYVHNGNRTAIVHSKKTGHKVCVQTAKVFYYKNGEKIE